MVKKEATAWALGIASLSLLASISIYSFARLHPPEILESLQATYPVLAAQTAFHGNAPSFFYTLALALFIGALASTPGSARRHCLIWIGLAICLELSQHPIVAGDLSTWLEAVLPGSAWEYIGSYWARGVFDRLDLIATLSGGFISMVLLTYLHREANDAQH